ncbi:portal protein [Longimicrobium sp.]|uniref:portal protein n=1 Tax=Longimicrobium sp. TaxID=2029185 RepID=UPI002E31112C|nr:portal protein [Longimicrobium sp.]HEX6038907.1 portal protein [Longimicrobium sp.]
MPETNAAGYSSGAKKGQTHAQILEAARKRFKLAVGAEKKQRDREKEDLQFQVPELQWDEAARAERMGKPGIPARPTLSISKIDQPIAQVENAMRQAHLGVEVHPLSPDSDDDTAEVIRGLYRKIEQDSRASLARSWAFARAIRAGRGYYRVNTKYDEAGGNPFDQVITIERILHQESVYVDPTAVEPDYCDAKFAFVAVWLTPEQFEAEYPKAKNPASDDQSWDQAGEDQPEWVRTEGGQRAIRVVEYWTRNVEKIKLCLYENGEVVEKGPGEEPDTKGKGALVAERESERTSVKVCKLTGFEVLDEADWNGRYIPLVPVIGRELQPIEGERRWEGIIRKARDAQKLFNFAASNAVERAALEPKAPFVLDPKQIDGYEHLWDQANTRSFPYLPVNMFVGAQQYPPPQRTQVDNQAMSPSLMLLQNATDWLQSTTATYDPSLGRQNPRERSGRAIVALQDQATLTSSDFLQNLAEISLTCEAKIVLDLLPTIYDRPGRIAQTLDLEGETETVMLNASFTADQNGRPRAAGEGMPGAKTYDLRKGVYSVAVSIGRSRQTLQQEAVDEIGGILQAMPALLPIIGPTWFRYRDFPGSKEIADMLGKMRDQQYPFLKDGAAPDDPAALKAQLQQQGQQMQAMGAQLQEAMNKLQTDQVKAEADIRKAEIDSQTRLETERLKAEAQIEVERIRAAQKDLTQTKQMVADQREAAMDRSHEAAQATRAETAAIMRDGQGDRA